MIAREAAYEALFALLQRVEGFVTVSRRLKHYSDVPPSQQPALFMCQAGETIVTVRGIPAKMTLRAKLWLYANAGNDPNAVPSTILNPLADAVMAALAPPPSQQTQTLGGAVSHAWVEGEVLTDEGLLGPQAAMILPISILVNT